jgi:hypothetical protein
LELREPEKHRDWQKHERQEKEDAWAAQEFGCMKCTQLHYGDSLYDPDNELLYTYPEARIYDPDYVGEAVATEAAEAYYARNVFVVQPQNCARALHRHLTVDRLPSKYRICKTSIDRTHLEIKPYSFIRHIRIDIWLGEYVVERLSQLDWDVQRRKLNYLYKKLTSALQLLPDPKREKFNSL